MREFDVPAGVRAVKVDAEMLPVIEAAKKVVHTIKESGPDTRISPDGWHAIRCLAEALEALFAQGIHGPANL